MIRTMMMYSETFYASEGTLDGISKSHHPSVGPSMRASIRNKSCLNQFLKSTIANFMTLHRKINRNKKVCLALELCFYT